MKKENAKFMRKTSKKVFWALITMVGVWLEGFGNQTLRRAKNKAAKGVKNDFCFLVKFFKNKIDSWEGEKALAASTTISGFTF